MKISYNPLSGSIIAPPSKSFAHRYMICAFLSKKPCIIKNVGFSEDVLTTCDCLNKLGSDCYIENGDFYQNSVKYVNSAMLNFNDSASAIRFILPVCGALGIKTTFIMGNSLKQRPNEVLLDILANNGCTVKNNTLYGQLKSGDYFLDCSLSSQFLTGLLFALSILGGKSTITVLGELVSKNYIDITLQILKDCNVQIEYDDKFIINKSNYILPENIIIEGDYSGASNFLVAGALSDKGVKVYGLNPKSVQGDKAILQIIKKFGANVQEYKDYVFVSKKSFRNFEYNCENIPDIVQIICVLACFADGETVLYNLDRLKLKESDRLQSVFDMLNSCKIKYNYSNNRLVIKGGRIDCESFIPSSDHRTVMCQTVLASNLRGSFNIENSSCVKKSYTEFFNDFCKLGGVTDVCL